MLARSIVRLTFTVGVLTIAVALVVAAVSTSGLAAEAARNRDLRSLQSVEDSVESHLRSVASMIEQATASTRERSQLETRLGVAYDTGKGAIEQIVMADRAGRVIAAYPPAARLERVGKSPAYAHALGGRAGFVSVPAKNGSPLQLWMTRTAIDSAGDPVFVLVRLDAGFLQRFLKETADRAAGRTVLIMQDDSVIGESHSGSRPRLASARWTVEGPQWGSVRTTTESGLLVRGHYNEIGGIEGIAWRAAILSPASEQVWDTARTVAPQMVVLFSGGMVALAIAWVLSLRLARPLREMERAALNAAAGGQVRQISVTRDDEVGRVAEAFNAVGLRLNALQDLSQLLASASSTDQVLDGIVSAVGHLVGRGACAVYLLEDDGTWLVPVRMQGYELSRADRVSGQSGWLASTLRQSEPVWFPFETSTVAAELPGLDGAELAVVACPLIAGPDQLGAIVVARDADRPFTEPEREMLRTFSAQAAVALHTSRLFEIESTSRRTAEALRLVAEELVRPTGIATSLESVTAIIAELYGSREVTIAVSDREGLGLAPAPEPEREREARILLVAHRLLGSGRAHEPVVLELGASEGGDELIAESGAVCILLVPTGLETGHGGVLAIALDEQVSASGIAFSRAVGDEIALALDNAYFYQRALARAANLETIFRISQAVGSSLQINVVLNRVLDVVQKILSADAVVLMSYNASARSLTTVMGRGVLPAALLHLQVDPGEDIPGQVYQRAEPLAVRDLNASLDGVARIAADSDLRSLLAVPLLARGRAIGVLMVFATDAGVFTEEDMNTLQTFASQAALAIDTARLYSREHEVASVLQASILPEGLPEFADVSAGSVYAPAGGEAEIGGDYYDLFRGRDGAVWFAIADVCGKGVYAATKTSMIKYVVRALATAGMGPARILGEINDMISETGDPSDIVTLWVGRFDAGTGQVRWADGGHPPGLLQREDGSVERLEVTGPLLGAVAGAPYDELEAELRAGDRLLLYTDGVTEARRGNIFFGEERLRAVLARPGTAQETADRVLAAVTDYVQGELRDDVAVLVVVPTDAGNREQD